MAGTGLRSNKISKHNTFTTNIYYLGYSTIAAIALMLLVIGTITLMYFFLGLSWEMKASRELVAGTLLYIFIFSLLVISPFWAVISKYMSDTICEEAYEDILPCYHVGLIFSMIPGAMLGIPFCLWEYFVGKVGLHYVFAGFCGFMSLILVFFTMQYLLICKDYLKIFLFFFCGMLPAFLLSLVLVHLCGWWEINFAILISLDFGFLLIAALEASLFRSYFRKNSGRYKHVLKYFGKYRKLIFASFLCVLGLFIHNFVFWTTDMRMIVAKSFVMTQPYDIASFLAMLTNISAGVIFIVRAEINFYKPYRTYTEIAAGGREADIQNVNSRMFRQLWEELHNLVKIQFIVSAAVFFIAFTVLPMVGFGGLVMWIYPCLAAGYFILFIMYSAIMLLYYFNDMTGALLTALAFCLVTFLGSLVSTHLPETWYGLGVVGGAFAGWYVSYLRLRWMERSVRPVIQKNIEGMVRN